MHFSIDRTVHTTAFDKPVVDHWLERKIAQTAAGSTEGSIRRPTASKAGTLSTELHPAPLASENFHISCLDTQTKDPWFHTLKWKLIYLLHTHN